MTPPGLDYLTHLAAESARFAAALAGAVPTARVPTCPDWSADDLFWHLGEVQWFWGTIVRDRVDGATAQQRKPPRPATWAGLIEFYRDASAELGTVLAATPPETAVWTWADDKTVGFVRRRQAHEALIHRIDAELTTGHRTAMDPQLSADGVDEALRVMHGGDLPPWGSFVPDAEGTLLIDATDTEDSWLVALGRFTGTDPDDEQVYDQAGIHVTSDGQGAAAVVRGTAADLDCWLWRRPLTGSLDWSGADRVRTGFDAIIAPGVS